MNSKFHVSSFTSCLAVSKASLMASTPSYPVHVSEKSTRILKGFTVSFRKRVARSFSLWSSLMVILLKIISGSLQKRKTELTHLRYRALQDLLTTWRRALRQVRVRSRTSHTGPSPIVHIALQFGLSAS